MARKPPPIQILRHSVQAAIAAYVLVVAIATTVGTAWSTNLHTICPFGGVVNLYTYFSTGGYVAKLHSAVFIMLLALLIGLVITGKSFCGWICPLGSVQEGLGGIGRRLWPRLYNRVPRRVERFLQYLKWAVLAWVLVQTARSVTLVFQDWDPYWNLYRIWTDEIAISGYVVTGVTLLAALFIPRPFSRYACPLGAFNGLFNSFSIMGIKRDAETCTDCGRCSKVCPVNIEVATSPAVRSIECTRCLKCVDACPQNTRDRDTLKLHTWLYVWTRRRWATSATGGSRRRSVPMAVFAAIAIAAFVLPILITNITGDFQTTKKSDFRTPDDIKGSTTLEEVIKNYGITKQELYNGLGLAPDLAASTQLKSLENNIEPEVLRDIARYIDEPLDTLGLAGVPADRLAEVMASTGLPGTATLRDLLRDGPPGAGLYLLTGVGLGEEPTVTTDGGQPATTTSTVPAGDEGSSSGATAEIKGKTTLGEIQAVVDDFAAFLEEFGIPADTSLGSTLSDLATQYGFEVSDVRTYLGVASP